MALTKEEVGALKTVYKRLGGVDGKMTFDCGVDYTAVIQEKTKLWRESWILPVIKGLIAKSEGNATSNDLCAVANAAKENKYSMQKTQLTGTFEPV